MNTHHFLVMSFPTQGLINPTFQLAKLLTRAGAAVIFATTVRGLSRLNTLPTLDGLFYATFSDGNEDGSKPQKDVGAMMAELKRVGSTTLADLLRSRSNEGRPVTFIIYSLLLPWAAKVARDMHVPSAFMCVQSATSFAIYHRYFNGQDGLYGDDNNNPTISIKLPELPLFTSKDVPTLLLPSSGVSSVIPTFQEHIKNLEEEPNPCVLINTFDALEESSIKAIQNMQIIPIGPLIPSAYSDQKDPSDTSPGFDFYEQSINYLPWLDSKPERSVIYVSFGSLAVLKKTQMEEILKGLVEGNRPFLWVIREFKEEEEEEVKRMIENGMNEKGLIVPWCSQVEVLCHSSTGCFFTHCGWNSMMENVVAGVPVVAIPQFSDQVTNAKMVDEVWRNGVRTKVNEDGVVERDEIKRCLDIVMGDGEKGEEIRRNSLKWKSLAMEALEKGGTSNRNFKQFLKRFE